MRNLTYDEAKAEYEERIDYQSGKYAGVGLENNTRLVECGNDYAVRLHRTDIVTLREDGDIVLRTGGWKTRTTKQRLNKYAPTGHIFQEDGRWYISTDNEVLLWSEATDIVRGPGIRLRPDGRVRERVEREPAMA